MALMNWDNTLSVSVNEIDGQHQKLVKLINDLHDAMLKRRTKEILDDILVGLMDYTKTHFSTEEKYFDQFSYLGSSGHKQEHKQFVEKVLDFKKGFDEGNMMLSMDVMNFLKDWLVTHIKATDKKYSKLFNENGLN